MRLNLLTVNNPKTVKGEKHGYLTFILHLAPTNLSRYNVCPKASPGCAAVCLNTAGRGGMVKIGETTNSIQEARIRKTRRFFENRIAFMDDLVGDVETAIRYAEQHGLIPTFRLNGTSDIRWETVAVKRCGRTYPHIMAAFPRIMWYDYTALPNRKMAHIPNYHLTFSRKETHTEQDVRTVLLSGMNVAVVFGKDAPKVRIYKTWAQRLAEKAKRDERRGRPKTRSVIAPRTVDYSWLPEMYAGFPVVCGDKTDLRFLDVPRKWYYRIFRPKPVVVGLTAKGQAKYDASGFVVYVSTK